MFENHYRRLSEENFVEMFEEMENRLRKIGEGIVGVASNARSSPERSMPSGKRASSSGAGSSATSASWVAGRASGRR